MRELTQGGDKCLSKALLDNVCDGQTGLEVYKSYFEPFVLVDEDASLSCVSRLKKFELEMRKNFYKVSDSKKEPSYFSFYSHHDVNRLGKVIDKEIVVYLYNDVTRPLTRDTRLDSSYRLEVFHDFRGLTSQRNQRQPVYFLFTTGKKLYKLLDTDDSSFCVSKPFFASDWSYADEVEKESSDGGCSTLGAACDFLLGVDTVAGEDLLKHPSDFVFVSGSDLYNRWRQQTVVVVYYCRNYYRGDARRVKSRKSVKKCYFSTLCIASGADSGSSISNMLPNDLQNVKVLCIYNKRFVCLLQEPFRIEILNRHLNTAGCKERLLNRGEHVHGFSRKLTSEVVQQALLQKETARKARLSVRQQKREEALLKIKQICKCSICFKDDSYSNNMAKFGPEKLCSTLLSITDLLKILGAYDDKTAADLDKVCELSIASMDIESKTVEVSNVGPRPGPLVDYDEVDSAVLEGHVKKVQKPIMIAHVDAGTVEASDFLGSCFTVAGDDDEHVFEMMERYWNYVLVCREEAIKKKMALLEPLYQLVEQYKTAYISFVAKWRLDDELSCQQQLNEALLQLEIKIGHDQIDEENASVLRKSISCQYVYQDWEKPEMKHLDRTWWQLIPGKLEKLLNKLRGTYQIFSFYG